jgi:hypothetical protein
LTNPLLETDATPEFDDDQLTVTPESTAPDSMGVAVSCTCWPVWIKVLAGATVTELGGAASTAAPTDAVTPLAMAVIVALPLCMSETLPDPDTMATDGSDDSQATSCGETACPDCVLGDAAICTVLPVAPEIALGDSVMTAIAETGALNVSPPVGAVAALQKQPIAPSSAPMTNNCGL